MLCGGFFQSSRSKERLSDYAKWEEYPAEWNEFKREFDVVHRQTNLDNCPVDLNITARAVQRWTSTNATDEFVQNFHDQTMLMVKNTRKYARSVDVDCIRLHVISSWHEEYNSWGQGNNNKRFRAVFVADSWEENVSYKLSLIDFDPAKRELKLINYSSVLPPRAFAAGHTGNEKLGDENAKKAKGKFGDGLQSACSVFARMHGGPHSHNYGGGQGIEIESAPGYKYQFKYQPQRHCASVHSLHYKLERNTGGSAQHSGYHQHQDHNSYHNNFYNEEDDFNPLTDTRVCLRGVDFERKRYLFLNPKYLEDECFRPLLSQTRRENRYEILRGPHWRNKIYVKGMLVQQPHLDAQGNRIKKRINPFAWTCLGYRWSADDKFYGYNLLDFDMKSRDRENSISMQEERHAIGQAWYEVLLLSREKADNNGKPGEMAKHLFTTLTRQPDCFESKVIGSSTDREVNMLRELLWDTFKMMHGPPRSIRQGMPVPAGNETKRKLILKCDYRPVELPVSLCQILAPFMPDLDAEWLSRRASVLESEAEDTSKCGAMIRQIATSLVRELLTGKVRQAQQNWANLMPDDAAKDARLKQRRPLAAHMVTKSGGGAKGATKRSFGDTRVSVRVVHSWKLSKEIVSISGESLDFFHFGSFPKRHEVGGIYHVRDEKVLNNNFTLWQLVNLQGARWPLLSEGNHGRAIFGPSYTGGNPYQHGGRGLPTQHFMYLDYNKFHLNYAFKHSTVCGNYRDSRPLATCVHGNWFDDTNRWIEKFTERSRYPTAKGTGESTAAQLFDDKESTIGVLGLFDSVQPAELKVTVNTCPPYEDTKASLSTHVGLLMFLQRVVDGICGECNRLRWHVSEEERRDLHRKAQETLQDSLGVQVGYLPETMVALRGAAGLEGGEDPELMMGEGAYEDDDDVLGADKYYCDDLDDANWPALSSSTMVAKKKDAQKKEERLGVPAPHSANLQTGAGEKGGKHQSQSSGQMTMNQKGNTNQQTLFNATTSDTSPGPASSLHPGEVFEIPNLLDANGEKIYLTQEQLRKKKIVKLPLRADRDRERAYPGSGQGVMARSRHAYESYDLAQTLTDAKYHHKNNDFNDDGGGDNAGVDDDGAGSSVSERGRFGLRERDGRGGPDFLNVPIWNNSMRLVIRGLLGFDPCRLNHRVTRARTIREDEALMSPDHSRTGASARRAEHHELRAAEDDDSIAPISRQTREELREAFGYDNNAEVLHRDRVAGAAAAGNQSARDKEVDPPIGYTELEVVPTEGKLHFQSSLMDVIRQGKGLPILKDKNETERFRQEQIEQLLEAQKMIAAWLAQLQDDDVAMKLHAGKKMKMGVPDGEENWHREIGLRDDRSKRPKGVESDSESDEDAGSGNEEGDFYDGGSDADAGNREGSCDRGGEGAQGGAGSEEEDDENVTVLPFPAPGTLGAWGTASD
eukprot:g13448.t1